MFFPLISIVYSRISRPKKTAQLAMHLYRKFHARGGVRRVYATADKNWDRGSLSGIDGGGRSMGGFVLREARVGWCMLIDV